MKQRSVARYVEDKQDPIRAREQARYNGILLPLYLGSFEVLTVKTQNTWADAQLPGVTVKEFQEP